MFGNSRGKFADVFKGFNLLLGRVSVNPMQGRILGSFLPRVQRPHIMRIGYAVVFIEALLQRKELPLAAKVPFAKNTGRVTLCFDNLRNRLLFGVQTERRRGTERA